MENIPYVHMRHTKHIWIKAPFHSRVEKRCFHHDHPKPGDRMILRLIDSIYDDSAHEVGQHDVSSVAITLIHVNS